VEGEGGAERHDTVGSGCGLRRFIGRRLAGSTVGPLMA
jgi:hypothetical protein